MIEIIAQGENSESTEPVDRKAAIRAIINQMRASGVTVSTWSGEVHEAMQDDESSTPE